MNTVVVPIKELTTGKSRLGPELDEAQRARLVLVLAERVVCAATAARGVDRVLVVCRDPQVLALADAWRAVPVPEDRPASGSGALNRALETARRSALDLGASALAVVVADLPTIEPEDVSALFDALHGGAEVVLARAHDGDGLGALALRPPPVLPFRFGDGRAFHHHLDEAVRRGCSVVSLHRPGLAFDLDTPEDLVACRSVLPMGWERLPIEIDTSRVVFGR